LSLLELLYQQEQVERPSSRFNQPKPARQTWYEFSNMLSDDLFSQDVSNAEGNLCNTL
jgi:hypothetical protein